MFVTEAYEMAPGVCRVCNTPNGPTINTGVDLDEPDGMGGWARLYVCFGCVDEMAALKGDLAPKARVDELEAELADAKKDVELAHAREAGAKEALEGFVKAGRFEVTADLFHGLTDEQQEAVIGRLPQKVRTAAGKWAADQKKAAA